MTFLLNVFGFSLGDSLTPVSYLPVQLPITLLILILTMRRADYHGLAWSRINPGFERESGSLE